MSRREVAPLAQLQAALPADAAFVAWVDVADKSGACRSTGAAWSAPGESPSWERLPGSGPGGKWTNEDTDAAGPAPRRRWPGRPRPRRSMPWRRNSTPSGWPRWSKHLDGVKRLFVAPVNQMAGIPIEALTDQYTVSYTPSGTYLARLKDRERPRSTRPAGRGRPRVPARQGMQPPTALPPGGLLITQVLPGGTAAKARLQAGDVLVAYAGEDLTSVEQLGKLIAAKPTRKPWS